MSPRRTGWDFAQIRTSFLSDPEFQRLSRVCRNDRDFLAAVGLWTIATAQAWREDSEDASEVLTSYPGFAKGPEYLRAADLIREGDRLGGFNKWTETVRRVREQDADRKRKGVQPTPAESSGVERSPVDFPRGVGVGVVVNEKGTDTRASAWDDFGPEWDPFRAAMAARGFRKPPTAKQRAALWPVVEARPLDVARWVSEAPDGAKYSEIVGHVFKAWDAFKTTVTCATPSERSDDLGGTTPARQGEAGRRLPNIVMTCDGCAGTLSAKGIEQGGQQFHERCVPGATDRSAEIKAQQSAERKAASMARRERPSDEALMVASVADLLNPRPGKLPPDVARYASQGGTG